MTEILMELIGLRKTDVTMHCTFEDTDESGYTIEIPLPFSKHYIDLNSWKIGERYKITVEKYPWEEEGVDEDPTVEDEDYEAEE